MATETHGITRKDKNKKIATESTEEHGKILMHLHLIPSPQGEVGESE
jgi:hypothetical protein